MKSIQIFVTAFLLLCGSVFAQTTNPDGKVGVGTTSPTHPMHVKAHDGSHVMLIQNGNKDGNGLKIQIDGKHGLADPQGTLPPPLPTPSSVTSGLTDAVTVISDIIINGQPFPVPDKDELVKILDPNQTSIYETLGVDEFVKAPFCDAYSFFTDYYNTLNDGNLLSIDIPNLNLDITSAIGTGITLPDLPDFSGSLPANFPDIPTLNTLDQSIWDTDGFSIPIPNFSFNINPPSFNKNICCGIGNVSINVPSFSESFNLPDPIITSTMLNDALDMDAVIKPAFDVVNTGITGFNTGISTVNNKFELVNTRTKEIVTNMQALDNYFIPFNINPLSVNFPAFTVPGLPLPDGP